jgi:hypothetical protein
MPSSVHQYATLVRAARKKLPCTSTEHTLEHHKTQVEGHSEGPTSGKLYSRTPLNTPLEPGKRRTTASARASSSRSLEPGERRTTASARVSSSRAHGVLYKKHVLYQHRVPWRRLAACTGCTHTFPPRAKTPAREDQLWCTHTFPSRAKTPAREDQLWCTHTFPSRAKTPAREDQLFPLLRPLGHPAQKGTNEEAKRDQQRSQKGPTKKPKGTNKEAKKE